MKLKCLVVDDEPIARQIIEKYCSHLDDLEIISSCGDALQAKKVLEKTRVDIIFLDINMPLLDGMAFARSLRQAPQIIFTTAYKEFAVDAFDLKACDYLLKPFSFDRFIQAVDKAKSAIAQDNLTADQGPSEGNIYIRAEGKIFKIDFANLMFAEASGNNVKIVMADHTFMPAMTFTNLEEMLPKTQFIRVHRSFIINKSKIRLIDGNRIMIGRQEIPIGSNYRDSFLREIGLK